MPMPALLFSLALVLVLALSRGTGLAVEDWSQRASGADPRVDNLLSTRPGTPIGRPAGKPYNGRSDPQQQQQQQHPQQQQQHQQRQKRSAKFESPSIVGRAVNDYVLRFGFKESAIAERLRLETAGHERSVMMGDPVEAAMFKVLLPAIGAKKVIEVGVFTGYTTLVMAQAVGPDGKIVALDVTDEYPSVGRPFWREAGVEDRIDLRIAPAGQSLQDMVRQGMAGTFDFAFLDADKVGYPDYYELLLQLVRTDGLIAIDNVLWYGRVLDDSVADGDTVALRRISELVQKDDRVEHVLLPIADGVTLVRKK